MVFECLQSPKTPGANADFIDQRRISVHLNSSVRLLHESPISRG